MYMAPSVSFSPLTMTPEQAITQYNTQVNTVNTHQVISCRLRQTKIYKVYMCISTLPPSPSHTPTTGLHFWVTNVSEIKFEFINSSPPPLTDPSTHTHTSLLNLPLRYRYSVPVKSSIYRNFDILCFKEVLHSFYSGLL